MENPEQKLDDIFRQRLHGAEVPPPPPVWPALEAELRKKRRKPVLWFWLLGFIGICTGMGLWYFGIKGSTETAVVAPVSTIEQPDIRTEQSLAAASTVNTPAEPATPEPARTPIAQPAVEKHKAAGKAGALPRGISPEKTSAKGVTENPEAVVLAAPGLVAATEQPVVEAEIPSAAVAEAGQADAGALKPLILDAWLTPSAPQALARSPKTPRIAPKKFKASSNRAASRQKLCYDFTRQPSAWLVDIYGGPSLAQRSLNSAVDDQPYLNQRLSTEHRNLAMNAGARVSFMFKGNFLLRSGVQYEQITETFEYIDPTSVTYTITWYPGNPVPDTLGVVYGENYLKAYNRYFFVDVPLTVGMEMRAGRSGFSLNAGIMANLLFDQRGVIIDPQSHQPARFGPVGKIAPKNGLSEAVFRSSAGLSATASLQWFWHLSPHYRLFVEPSFRQILRPVSLSTHPVEHRYSIFSLRLGATKIF